MLRFAFWNLNRKRLDDLVVDLVRQEKIDILLLAEAPAGAGEVVHSLNRGVSVASDLFHAPLVPGGRSIILFTRFLSDFAKLIRVSERITIREMHLPARQPFLLVAVHLPSKLYAKAEDQQVEAGALASYIDQAETAVGHRRTVLVGDFNMNPFESGMVMADGIHGVMTRSIALRRDRVLRGRKYPFFYNPMWNRFGDETPGPAGTYYYGNTGQVTHFWNMFDQVLIRPDLLAHFDSDRLRIVDRIGSKALTTARGTPNKILASDHLPILFELNL